MLNKTDDGEIVPGVWTGDFVMRKGGGKFFGGKVKQAYVSAGKVLIDLKLYSAEGVPLPRQSPVEGGPTSFEPALELDDFVRIKGTFPIDETLKWLPDHKGDQRLLTARRAHEESVTVLPFRAQKRAERRVVPHPVSGNRHTVEGASKRLAAEHIRAVAKETPDAETRLALMKRAQALETEAARDDAPMKG